MSIDTFIASVDAGIAAPGTLTNRATWLGWSAQEKTGLHPAPDLALWNPMQWNNPLNTTHDWPGAVSVNTKGVKQYATEQDGIAATCATLLEAVPGVLPNGYDALVNRFRHSLPAMFWGDTEIAQLGVWGTGGSWLTSVALQGDSPMEEEILALFNALENGPPGSPNSVFATGAWHDFVQKHWVALLAAVANVSAPAPDLAALTQAIQANTTELANVSASLTALSKHLGVGTA